MNNPISLSRKYEILSNNDNHIQDKDDLLIAKSFEQFHSYMMQNGLKFKDWYALRFKEVCFRVSSILVEVSDTSLSEIDDLIIPDLTESHFHYICVIPPVTEAEEKFERFEITLLEFIINLIETLMITRMWLAVKFMRLVTDRYKDWLNKCNEKYIQLSKNIIVWILKLKNIPQPKCPRIQKITSWISRQSEILLDRLDISWFSTLEHKFSTWTLDPESYVCNLMAEDCGSFFLKIDHLHSYFMSASDDSQKVKLIESFVKGCVQAKKCSSCIDDIPSEHAFLRYTRDIITDTLNNVLDITDCDREGLEKIGKYYSFHFEPYLSDYSSVGLQSYSHQQLNEKFENSLNLKNDEEPDLTIEKHLYYDDAIKSLQLISILHIAFLRSADILKIEKFPINYESLIFRCVAMFESYVVRGFPLNYFFIPKNVLYLNLLKICPFVFLSQCHMYLKEDLLKGFKGESIDEETLTEIYFALKVKPNYCKEIKKQDV